MRTAAMVTMLVVLGVLGGVERAPGDEAPSSSTTTTLPRPALTQTTQIEGTPPDLEGRWLFLATLGIGTSPRRVMPSAFDVTRRDGTLEIRERHIVLPPAQNQAIQHANSALGGMWAPRQSDLDAIATAWDTLEPEDRGIAQIVHQLTGRDAFDDDLKKEALTKDALWVLRQSYVFLPGGNRPVNQGNLIAPLAFEDGVYSGNFLAVTVAAAPFPIPIKFEGTFRLIRIGAGSRSLWSRLGDFFAGCGGR